MLPISLIRGGLIALCAVLATGVARAQDTTFQVTVVDFANLIEGTRTKAFPDVSKFMGGIDREILPETVQLADLVKPQCKFKAIATERENLDTLSTLPPLLKEACLFPIVVAELSKRRLELLSGTVVELNSAWTPQILQAGQFRSVMFSPRSPAKLVTEYLLLQQALRLSANGFSRLMLVQNRDLRLPTFTQQLLRLNAAAQGPFVALQMSGTATYMERIETPEIPPYVRGWQALVRATADTSIGPYREQIRKLGKALRTRPQDPRFRRLADVYNAAASLEDFASRPDAGTDLVRFVLSAPVSDPETARRIQTFAAYITSLATSTTRLPSNTVAAAFGCAALLPLLETQANREAVEVPPVVTKALSNFPRFNALSTHARSELAFALGALELYLSRRPDEVARP